MLTVATQRSAPPYLAVTAGPASHSPPPIAEAPITSPGPIMASQFFQVNFGASISSATFQRGICFDPGWGATYSGPGLFGGSDGGWAAFFCSIDIACFLIRNSGDMINDKRALVKEVVH